MGNVAKEKEGRTVRGREKEREKGGGSVCV